jgi:dTDP-4-amino-4,6-dideoxygalactose transaminase
VHPDLDWQWPRYTEEEADALRSMLLTNKVNYWTGTECREFEREFAQWCGSAHAVSLANGTLALEAALRALGIAAGDEVIVSPRTFLASVSCVVSAGATPVFADVDRDSGNLTAATIEGVLTARTRAVVCVHLAGWPCDMPSIMSLARSRNLRIVEDCAQAHGARVEGRMVGSFGDVGAWSFCQDKIISTGGEGGMVTTDDRALWSRMWAYKDHGKSWDAVYEREHPPGFRWVHESFGSNWRMLEAQAVIGRIQLRRMDEWHARRLANARAIWDAARALPGLRVPEVPGNLEHAAYRCYVYAEPRRLRAGWSRDRIIAEIAALGVPCMQGSCSEVYRERAFDGTNWRPQRRLPVARELGETSIAFLVHPTLPQAALERLIDALTRVMKRAAA